MARASGYQHALYIGKPGFGGEGFRKFHGKFDGWAQYIGAMPVERPAPVTCCSRLRSTGGEMKDGKMVGSVRKTDRAEVRVTRQMVKGRPCVDIRIWWLPEGQTEYVPSRKGFTMDVGKALALQELLSAL